MTYCSAVDAYIGLGSNLEEPEQQVRRALAELAALDQTELEQASPLYWSAPLGPPGQPEFVNAAARLRTRLEPLALLDALQSIEQAHQRVRGERWGPRTLDLDLLLYGTEQIDSERLIVPHPRLYERRFVLLPLVDIAPELRLPDGRRIDDLLAQCPPWEMRPVSP
jgi:2-amino-4-hydroxy-6-hydroxymethyldihydropteridine diphosphokinase